MNKQIQNTINYKKLLIKMKINIKKKHYSPLLRLNDTENSF